MKSKEELDALKEEVKAVSKKLAELTEEELEQVAGGKLEPDFKLDFKPDIRSGIIATLGLAEAQITQVN